MSPVKCSLLLVDDEPYILNTLSALAGKDFDVLTATSAEAAMQVMGKEFKIPVVQLDPMETGEGSKDFYERVTRKNLDALVAAFHGG